jgi:hypothetical protein
MCRSCTGGMLTKFYAEYYLNCFLVQAFTAWNKHDLYLRNCTMCCTYSVTLRGVGLTVVAVQSNMYYIFWVCVCSLSYPTRNVLAPYRHLWPVWLYRIFPHYVIKKHDFRKINLSIIKCLLILSTDLSETFLILRKTERYVIGNVYWPSCAVPLFLSDINDTWISSTGFQKIVECQISWKSVQWEPSCSVRTDAQTDVMKLIVAFSNFANTPENSVRTAQ